jgi:hypothetical protein
MVFFFTSPHDMALLIACISTSFKIITAVIKSNFHPPVAVLIYGNPFYEKVRLGDVLHWCENLDVSLIEGWPHTGTAAGEAYLYHSS